MQVSSGRPHILTSNQRGRGNEPVTVLGRIRLAVAVNMGSSDRHCTSTHVRSGVDAAAGGKPTVSRSGSSKQAYEKVFERQVPINAVALLNYLDVWRGAIRMLCLWCPSTSRGVRCCLEVVSSLLWVLDAFGPLRKPGLSRVSLPFVPAKSRQNCRLTKRFSQFCLRTATRATGLIRARERPN